MRVVILAGGSGKRLWPLSRRHRPKQLQVIEGNQSLLAKTCERIQNIGRDCDIRIATVAPFASEIQQLCGVAQTQLLLEPDQRDTGPAIAYACIQLCVEGLGDEPVSFLPSDHRIDNASAFHRALTLAQELTHETGQLVLMAVPATAPVTSLGYSIVGDVVRTEDDIVVHTFHQHVEKPDVSVAEQLIASGNAFWHVGCYTWTPRSMLDALKTMDVEFATNLDALEAAIAIHDVADIQKIYQALPKRQIDNILTTQLTPGSALVVIGAFDWADLGSWDTAIATLAARGGRMLRVASDGSVAMIPSHKMAVLVGLPDVLLVDTGDVVLALPQSRLSELKSIVEQLEGGEFESYL